MPKVKIDGLRIGQGWVLACAVAATPLLAAPASAAPFGGGYRFSRDEADQSMSEFAHCVVGNHRRRIDAEHFVRAIPQGPAFVAAGRRLATPDCVPGGVFAWTRMHFQPDLFRAALFSAFYQRDFGRAPPPDPKAVLPLAIAAEFDGPADDIPKAILFQRIVGDCTARAAPAEVHALLTTRVASGAEKEALAKVVSPLAGCIPAGRQTAFSRSMLRGLLAEALYKLRQAATPSAPEAGK